MAPRGLHSEMKEFNEFRRRVGADIVVVGSFRKSHFMFAGKCSKESYFMLVGQCFRQSVSVHWTGVPKYGLT